MTSAAIGPNSSATTPSRNSAPLGHAHVNPNGRYRFGVSALPAGQLRPLRERTDGDERASRPSPPILVNGDKH
jgi:hypothetical protein